MERDAPSARRLTLALVLVVVAYAAGVWAIGFSTHREVTAPWWPAGGIGAVATVIAPRSRRILVLAALFAAYTLANVTGGREVGASFLLGLADVVETALVTVLTVRFIGPRIRSMLHVWVLFLIAVVGAFVAGLGIAATSALLLDGSFWSTLEITTAAHAASLVILLPLALISWRRTPLRVPELAAQVMALTATTAVTFGPRFELTLAFTALPLIMWAAVRFDARVVVLEQIAFAAAVTLCTRFGWGPFARFADEAGASSTQLAQLYLICVVVIGLPLTEAIRQRDRAVARLSASERVFRRNFTESRVPVALVRLEGSEVTFSTCNDAAARLFGLPVADIAHRHVGDLLTAGGMLDEMRAAGAAAAGDWSGPLGLTARPRIRLEGILSLLDTSGDRTYFSLHLVDVTAPLELQERLEQERNYTRAVIDTASSMIVLTDIDGMVIAANPATTTLTGYAEEELVGHRLWETLVAEERRESVAERFGDPDRLARVGEAVLRTKSGGKLTVEFSNAVHQITPDAPTTYVLSGTDVTAEREHAGMVNHLLRSATTIAFIGTDLQGRITVFNTGAERMLGTRAEAATGRDFMEFFSLEDVVADVEAPTFASIVRQAQDEVSPETRDWTWLPEGRSPLKVSMTTNPVTDSYGEVIGYLFVARDITDTRRSQEILVRALRRERDAVARLKVLDQAKDEFVSTVSHELRTPMSSIIGGAEMLAEGILGDLEPAQQRMVDVITRNGDRLLGLADDLLMLATFDRNSWPEQSTRVDLRSVLQESGGSIGAMLANRRLDVDFQSPAEEVVVNGDPSHLERAVTNLLTNAVKFTPDGGRIEVSLTQDPTRSSAMLSVADTGLGISAPELGQVFEKFFRSTLVQERAIQGSGLGLAIVKNIVENHDGRIDVSSEPGAGTTFTITLPLARTSQRASS